jgi:hypothetical protein
LEGVVEEREKWPFYSYSMGLLNNEELALFDAGRWYLGKEDGALWIYRTAKTLLYTYYK